MQSTVFPFLRQLTCRGHSEIVVIEDILLNLGNSIVRSNSNALEVIVNIQTSITVVLKQ